jgi:hypothetical protein
MLPGMVHCTVVAKNATTPTWLPHQIGRFLSWLRLHHCFILAPQLDEFDGVGFTASDVLLELLAQYDQQSSQEQTKVRRHGKQQRRMCRNVPGGPSVAK